LSIAIAVAAVAALVDSFWLLYVAWGSGALGIFFGIAGFRAQFPTRMVGETAGNLTQSTV
jgi:hypothetical protein